MSKTSLVGGEPGTTPGRTPDVSQTRSTTKPTTATITGTRREIQAVMTQPKSGFRARVKRFLSVPLYRFIIRLTSPNQAEQKSLAEAINQAHKVNQDAWNTLGKNGSSASPRELKALQLACERAQLRLDHLEGRKDSPTTIQREAVITLLESAMKASEEQFIVIEQQYLEATKQLKTIELHQVALEAELDAATRELEKHKASIGGSFGKAPDDLEVANSTERKKITTIDSEALEKRQQLESTVAALKAEFKQFQKNLIDEEIAKEAHLRYGFRAHHKTRGKSHE